MSILWSEKAADMSTYEMIDEVESSLKQYKCLKTWINFGKTHVERPQKSVQRAQDSSQNLLREEKPFDGKATAEKCAETCCDPIFKPCENMFAEDKARRKKELKELEGVTDPDAREQIQEEQFESCISKHKIKIGRIIVCVVMILIAFGYSVPLWVIHSAPDFFGTWTSFHVKFAVFALSMTLISYFSTMMTNPGMSAPKSGSLRGEPVCPKCAGSKPERTHHCSVCGTCVHRMDHHCPWVNVCVGVRNHKQFSLFLFYTVMGLLYGYEVEMPEHCVHTPTQWTLITLNLLELFGLSIGLGSLALWNLRGILLNQTTLEYEKAKLNKKKKLRPMKKSAQAAADAEMDAEATFELERFNVGMKRNWVQVFGANYWMWLIPTPVDNDPFQWTGENGAVNPRYLTLSLSSASYSSTAPAACDISPRDSPRSENEKNV